MADLGQIIRQTQREAAALPTDKLREEIEINLDVQDAAIRLFTSIRPGAGPDERIVATGTVLISVLTTALYVAELATRPVAQTRVVHSLN